MRLASARCRWRRSSTNTWNISRCCKELDLGDVGDFIDLASTLVELKSQAVLPKVVEESEEEEIVDPQSELVERLLQYKEIRDAAAILDEMGDRWQQRYERMSDDLADPSRRSRGTSRSSTWRSGTWSAPLGESCVKREDRRRPR